jgi:hypothetical protein
MARRFLAALALAQGASALLDGFVDVLVNVEHRVPADAFAGVMNAAGGSDDDGYDACVVANDVLESCYAEGYMEPTAAVDDADRCLCCAGPTPISKVYSSCASYASNEVPGATADYTGTPSPRSVSAVVGRYPVLTPPSSHKYVRLLFGDGHLCRCNG